MKNAGKRLKSWARTCTKLALLVLGYFWLGAAYKVIYAQTHDLTRFKNRLPISFYQQEFLLESLLHVTWLASPDFRDYIGTPPSVGALVGQNPQVVLADYCRQRERELSALPTRYPRSLFVEEALEDAFLLSEGAAFLGLQGGREVPSRALAVRDEKGAWRALGLPEIFRAGALARRLADEYPDSSHAPVALLRLAQMEDQQGHFKQSRAIYERITREYPQANEAEDAANALFGTSLEARQLQRAREYKLLALNTSERLARERFPGKPLPSATALHVLGYHVDLSVLDLQLRRLAQAQEMLDVAWRETERLKALPGLDGDSQGDLRRARQRMEGARSEAWVAKLYQDLKVGLPGPPPQPREFNVSGRTLLDDRPLAGVELMLAEADLSNFQNVEGLLGMARSRYRAVSDTRGEFRIAGVPAGRYSLLAIYNIRPPQSGAAPIELAASPQPAAKPTATPAPGPAATAQRIVVNDKPVTVAPLRFVHALQTTSYGELKPVGNAVRLAWRAWPGARAYRVEVLAPQGRAFQFEQRIKANNIQWFERHPVLWQVRRTAALQADCPLLALAPDFPSQVRAMQFEYTVTALDGAGRAVASSTAPLCRFLLAPEALAAFFKLSPPTRRGGVGLFGARRRRRGGRR